MQHALVARQAIYDKSMNVYGYELLFRSAVNADSSGGDGGVFSEDFDGDSATSTVILNTFSDIGIDDIIGNSVAFVNFTKNLICNNDALALPSKRVVIEILEDIMVDQKVVAAVSHLSKEGYTIALDDFIYRPELDPLIEMADVIKVDVLNMTQADIEAQLLHLKHFKGKLLAEKVEDHDMLSICIKLGFDYFQGFFLDKPNTVQGKKVETNKMIIMNLVSKMQDPDLDMHDIETIISQDPKLSYKILRIVNTVAYAASTKIESLKEAIVRMGIIQIKQWANLLALTAVDSKPADLIDRTLIRAKMCELLGQHIKSEFSKDQFFSVGLFSTLDAMLDEPMFQLLSKLPLNEDMKTALLANEGELGEVLKMVVAYEHARWEALNHPKLTQDDYGIAYMDSLEWLKTVKID